MGTNENRVTTFYKSILGRNPDAGGLQYWTSQLNGGVSGSTVINALASSSEAKNRFRTDIEYSSGHLATATVAPKESAVWGLLATPRT